MASSSASETPLELGRRGCHVPRKHRRARGLGDHAGRCSRIAAGGHGAPSRVGLAQALRSTRRPSSSGMRTIAVSIHDVQYCCGATVRAMERHRSRGTARRGTAASGRNRRGDPSRRGRAHDRARRRRARRSPPSPDRPASPGRPSTSAGRRGRRSSGAAARAPSADGHCRSPATSRRHPVSPRRSSSASLTSRRSRRCCRRSSGGSWRTRPSWPSTPWRRGGASSRGSTGSGRPRRASTEVDPNLPFDIILGSAIAHLLANRRPMSDADAAASPRCSSPAFARDREGPALASGPVPGLWIGARAPVVS